MADEKPVYWGIHVKGQDGDALYLQKCYIGIGWSDVGDLRKLAPTRDAFKACIAAKYPDEKKKWHINAGSQLFRFVHEMKPGDFVVYRSRYDNQIHIGKIEGEYEHRPDLTSQYVNVRKVKWEGAYSITIFSSGALHELGSALTLFQVANYADEYRAALTGEAMPLETPEDAAEEIASDVRQTAEDFIIKQLAKHLKGYGFQTFVAHLLTTMGYRTVLGAKGTDEGVDIIAHKDELMLEPPIIKVQVKSSEGNVGAPDARQLNGNLGTGEYGLLITLGGYVKQAKEFVKARPNLRLVDGKGLVELVLRHYEKLDPKYKALIPLKQVYIPQVAKAEVEEGDEE